MLPAAALCRDESLRAELRLLAESIESRDTPEQRAAFENRMHDILFRMIDRPLMELLARVTMRHYTEHPDFKFYSDEDGGILWKLQRHNILNAILQSDPELARFEAMRRRTHLMELFDEGNRSEIGGSF